MQANTIETIIASETVEFTVRGARSILKFEVDRLGREWTVKVSRGRGFVFVGRLYRAGETLKFYWASKQLEASHEAVLATEYVFAHMAQLEARGAVKVTTIGAENPQAVEPVRGFRSQSPESGNTGRFDMSLYCWA